MQQRTHKCRKYNHLFTISPYFLYKGTPSAQADGNMMAGGVNVNGLSQGQISQYQEHTIRLKDLILS